jgi:translation elongation factor EF-Ts
MKPKSLGELPIHEAKTEEIKFDENESRLLYQEFLMKPNTRVLDFLNEHHAILNDYVRIECGELVENEPGVQNAS